MNVDVAARFSKRPAKNDPASRRGLSGLSPSRARMIPQSEIIAPLARRLT